MPPKRPAVKPAKRLAGLRKNLFPSPPAKTRAQHANSSNAPSPPAVPFPDIGDAAAVHRAYRLTELQQMLQDVGLDATGIKDALSKRVAAHARTAPTLTGTSGTDSFSDLQALYVLQQHNAHIDPDPDVRRVAAAPLIQASSATPGAPPNTAPSPTKPPDARATPQPTHPPQVAPPILPAQVALEREVHELRAAILLMQQSHTPPPAYSAPAPPQPTGVDAIAQAMIRALQDVHASTQGDVQNSSVSSDSVTVSRIQRTAPAQVDPRQHDNDPHKLGLLVHRMTTISFSDAEGLSAITWRRSCADKIAAIHERVHAESSPEAYSEGEARFFTHICEMLTIAARHDRDAEHQAARRQQQLLWWIQAWDDVRQTIRDATRFWGNPTVAYRIQMEDLISTAMGVGLSNAQLRNLQVTSRLREELGGGSRQADHRQRRRDAPSYPPSAPAYQPSAPGPPPRYNDRHAPSNHSPRRGGNGPDPNAVTGTRMPQARGVIGVSSVGAIACSVPCPACDVVPVGNGEGHRPWECPRKFAEEHPGRHMPGFDEHGFRRPGAWNGNNITEVTRRQWERMRTFGFFLQGHAPTGRQGQAGSGAQT
jgi:hypothetical protein